MLYVQATVIAVLLVAVGARQWAHVQLSSPRYIEIVFNLSKTFIPESLTSLRITSGTGDNSRATIVEPYRVPFSFIDKNNQRIFRNLIELKDFRKNETITLELGYKDRGNSDVLEYENLTTEFDYNILTNRLKEVIDIEINTEKSSRISGQNAKRKPMRAKCSETRDYLAEQLNTALELGTFNTRLILKSTRKPVPENAVDTIRDFIVDKLYLPKLAWNISQARFLDEGLLFEMMNAQQTVEILTQARLLLKDSLFRVESTTREFFDMSDLQRRLD